jgi:hypothetical protein
MTVQTLHTLGFSVSGYALLQTMLSVGIALAWFVVSGVIFWRKSDDWMALFVALFLVVFAAGNAVSTNVLSSSNLAWSVPVELVQFLSSTSIILFCFLFPNGRFVPHWTAIVVVIWTTIEACSSFFPDSFLSISQYPLLNALTFLFIVGLAIFAQIYRFRRVSDPLQRQQTKWVVFGVVAAGLGIIGLGLPFLLFPSQTANGSLYDVMIDPVYGLILLFIPLSVGLTILRHRLWDIDVIINRSLVYITLTSLLALIYVGLIFALQFLLNGIVHSNNDVAIVISTLIIAALFQPLRARTQQVIDRRFYRQKYDAARTLTDFSAALRKEVDLNILCDHLVTVVQETMQPTYVSLWLRQRGKDDERHEEISSTPLADI